MSRNATSDSVQQTYTVVPVGEIGDGAVRVRYTPNPEFHRSKFEIEYAWSSDEVDRVYVGDTEHAEDLIATLEEIIEAERTREGGE